MHVLGANALTIVEIVMGTVYCSPGPGLLLISDLISDVCTNMELIRLIHIYI